MIEITEENIDSMIASIDSTDEEEYVTRVWTHMEDYNPAFLEFMLDVLDNYDNEEEKNAFLDGSFHCYELVRRQIEAYELENS